MLSGLSGNFKKTNRWGASPMWWHISQTLPRYAKSTSLFNTVNYKIDDNSETKNRTEKTHEYNNSDHNIVQLLRET